MKILFVGDIVGGVGRRCLARWLPPLRRQHAIDFVVGNGENAAGGLGATPKILEEMSSTGLQAITLGNHTWRQKELVTGIEPLKNVVRPANYPPGTPGRGSQVIALPDGRKVGVVNLVGRVYMDAADCPFRVGRHVVEQMREQTPIVLVDFHAEATAEKVAMGWYLDGVCSAVLGTHTHVQTSDARVLPDGTAYITDVGMTGPRDSVIGVERDMVIQKFITGIPVRFKTAQGPAMLCGAIVEVDDTSGRATSIQAITQCDGEDA